MVTATPEAGAEEANEADPGEAEEAGQGETESGAPTSPPSSSGGASSGQGGAAQPIYPPAYTATSPSNQGSSPTATSAPTNSATSAPPTATPASSTQAAETDNDSTFNPAAYKSLAPTGDRRQLVYSDEVSSPQGDFEDWIEFTTVASQNTTNYIWVSLSCNGSAQLRAQMYDADSHTEITGAEFWLECGTVDKQITTTSNYDYQFRIYPRTDGYTEYTITVKGVR